MTVDVIIFFVSLLIFLPLAAPLLYVWWKYGKEEIGVAIARVVFLVGSALLFGYMLML